MSFTDAHALASSLLTVIIIFRAGDGSLSVVPADDFDGDAEIVAELDPLAP